jgi:hypothetical protein
VTAILSRALPVGYTGSAAEESYLRNGGESMSKQPVLAALVACLAMLAAMVPSVAAEDTPKAFLEKLYAAYAAPNKSGVNIDTDKALARYFSPEVIKLMDKMYAAAKKTGDVPALDGDPFIDAQDWDIKSFDITVDQAGNDKATGHVHFKNLDAERSITLDLIHLKPGWRIDDINWGEGTLRKLLTAPQSN